LKRFRIAFSCAAAILMIILFCDIRHVLPSWTAAILPSFQFIPVILSVVGGVTLAAGVTLGALLLFTVLFGRVYCSTLCPLGFYQDLIIRLSRKINRRKRYRYRPAHTGIHYSLLGITGIAWVAGSMVLFDIIEPYSIFGRMAVTFIQPAVVLVNNLGTRLLIAMHVYALHTAAYPWQTAGTLLFTVAAALTVGVLSYTRGRLFCNLLCPAGALLGIISRGSLFRLTIDRESCNECGACERVCKAECIDSPGKQIDAASCVGCFNCIHSCPHGSIGYRWHRGGQKVTTEKFDDGRRSFFGIIGAPVTALLAPAGVAALSPKPVKSTSPVTPPGSGSAAHFSGTCTACQLCVTACPSRVLTPTLFEYGLGGLLQPMMNYSTGFCNYECTICGEVCPTGAIQRVAVDHKKLIQIGKSTFVREDCVVVAKKKDCAACSEHCPTKAVHTVPYESGLFIPELNNDLCIGCGACEYACPVQPAKAIFVTANPVHATAKKPVSEIQPQPSPVKQDDFPF
jgi:polyferredoxin